MLKALSKLTKSKSIPPSSDQIEKHKDLKRLRDTWQSDVDKLQAILTDLSSAYGRHKGDFALGRYEELKTMVKTSIERLTEVSNENKNHRTLTGGATLRGGDGGGACSMSRLRDNAADFARLQGSVAATEKVYSEISSKDLDKELIKFNRDIVELKNDFRTLRDRIENLGKEYEESKKLNPAQRYAVLKEMIKTATTNSTSNTLR